jgi:hypothetical protein
MLGALDHPPDFAKGMTLGVEPMHLALNCRR